MQPIMQKVNGNLYDQFTLIYISLRQFYENVVKLQVVGNNLILLLQIVSILILNS